MDDDTDLDLDRPLLATETRQPEDDGWFDLSGMALQYLAQAEARV